MYHQGADSASASPLLKGKALIARQVDQGRGQWTPQVLSESQRTGQEIYVQASLRHVCRAGRATIRDPPDNIVTGHCRLPLLSKSGNSSEVDLRNPADFQRFTAWPPRCGIAAFPMRGFQNPGGRCCNETSGHEGCGWLSARLDVGRRPRPCSWRSVPGLFV